MGRKRGFVADRDGMFADYQSGMTQAEIADKHGINQSNVSVNLRKHPDWPRRRRVIKKSQNQPRRKEFNENEMILHYKSGMSVLEIAKRQGISQAWAGVILRRCGDWRERRRALRTGCFPVIDGSRQCLTCSTSKPVGEFPKHKPSPFGILAHCVPCYKRLRSEYSREIYRKLRDAVVDGYGGKCSGCGFDNRLALNIDHVHNDGCLERKALKAITLLRKIIRERFPDKYQLLCANCNTIKAHGAGSFSRIMEVG